MLGITTINMADEQADAGVVLDGPTYFVGPQKYGTLPLRIKPDVRSLISSELEQVSLPQDIAPNKTLTS